MVLAGMPESQWPAAWPTQQAIVFALSEEALETGTSIAKKDKAIAIATSFSTQRCKATKRTRCVPLCLCTFVEKIFISLTRRRGLLLLFLLDDRLAHQLHLALPASAS